MCRAGPDEIALCPTAARVPFRGAAEYPGSHVGERRLDMTGAQDERMKAFSGWARQRMPQAYRLAVAILHDETAAEDAVQDAVLRAWAAWPRLRERSRLDAWLDRIIVNCCRDRLRRQARTSHLIRELSLVGDGPDSDRQYALRQAMTQLSPDHQIAVTLRYFDDLSIEEIAERTGCRQGTVKSRLHYALSALRAAYDATERK
jgi:RNA polymerase sigma-70 factor (ECF subfamily)